MSGVCANSRGGSGRALLGDAIEIAVEDGVENDDPVVTFDQTRRQSLVVWRRGNEADGDSRIMARFVPAGGDEPPGDPFFRQRS